MSLRKDALNCWTIKYKAHVIHTPGWKNYIHSFIHSFIHSLFCLHREEFKQEICRQRSWYWRVSFFTPCRSHAAFILQDAFSIDCVIISIFFTSTLLSLLHSITPLLTSITSIIVQLFFPNYLGNALFKFWSRPRPLLGLRHYTMQRYLEMSKSSHLSSRWAVMSTPEIRKVWIFLGRYLWSVNAGFLIERASPQNTHIVNPVYHSSRKDMCEIFFLIFFEIFLVISLLIILPRLCRGKIFCTTKWKNDIEARMYGLIK